MSDGQVLGGAAYLAAPVSSFHEAASLRRGDMPNGAQGTRHPPTFAFGSVVKMAVAGFAIDDVLAVLVPVDTALSAAALWAGCSEKVVLPFRIRCIPVHAQPIRKTVLTTTYHIEEQICIFYVVVRKKFFISSTELTRPTFGPWKQVLSGLGLSSHKLVIADQFREFLAQHPAGHLHADAVLDVGLGDRLIALADDLEDEFLDQVALALRPESIELDQTVIALGQNPFAFDRLPNAQVRHLERVELVPSSLVHPRDHAS